MDSSVLGEDSENDSDFGESEDDDEDITIRKSKVKEIKKKGVKIKSPVEKKEKKPKSRCNTLGKLSPKHFMKEMCLVYLMGVPYICLCSP